MTTRRLLRGTELRYVLTLHLARHGAATVAELVKALEYDSFTVRGRPSKAVSDALRWEMGRGRVYRIGRGRYRFAEMPRGTEYRIVKRVAALKDEAKKLSRAGGQQVCLPGQMRLGRV